MSRDHEGVLEKMIDQMYWSNQTMIDWIKSEAGIGDEFMKLASHILNAEQIWICRANQVESERDTFKVRSIPEMEALNDSNHSKFEILSQSDLKQPVDYKLFDGSPGRSSREDMILHVFSHGFHHAGQMAAMAAKLGKKFPNVSYIGFTRRT